MVKRKIIWDQRGVSEVIGTILTLSITVILFSGIILMVDEFPAPGDNVYTNFTATIEPKDDWNNGAYIHITNTGGEQMAGMWTIIILSIDDYTYTLETQGSLDGWTYGIGPGAEGHRGTDNGDDNWDTGERWTLYRNATSIDAASDVGVMILNSERNALVWTAAVQGVNNEFGPIITNIRADSDLGTLRSDPVEYGMPFIIYADVYDSDGDLNTTSVFLDFSSIHPDYGKVNMTDPDNDGTFISEELMGPNTTIPIGYHMVIIQADDLADRHSFGVGRIAVGQDIGGQPNLVITANDIDVSSQNPINGQTVLITVTVKNFGGYCNGALNFYDMIGSESNLIEDDEYTANFTISDGPDQITKTIRWDATPGGEHTIKVEAIPFNATDATPEDNFNYTDITVMPSILIVDDDNHVADMTIHDTNSYMRAALESSNFEYDIYTVGAGQDGPEYNAGQTKLKDYDIVIWMTGYESTNTLTDADQDNLTAFLNDELNRGRAGSLWLIGQYIYDDPEVIGSTFLTEQIKTDDFAPSVNGPTNPMRGVVDNPISDGWNTSFIPIIDRVPGEKRSYKIRPDPEAETTFKDSLPLSTWGDAINYENASIDERIVFFPWEFSRIEKMSDQAQVAYKVLMWLGNITTIFVNDLAISEQTVDPSYVFYNQEVTIDAIIRNNGKDDLTTEAILFLDGEPLMDKYIRDIDVDGMGGTASISINWTANILGTHVLKWMVDPQNTIAESNEGNNMVPSYVTTGEVYVEFRILVVDDDESEYNNGLLNNETLFLTDSLNRLNYYYESDNGINTTYIVNASMNGPSYSILKDYSLVIWVTGNSPSGLTTTDSNNLESYLLNNKGRLWLIGDDIMGGIIGENLTELMGLDSITANAGLTGTLQGVDNSSISHGMNISILNNAGVDELIPIPEAEGVFYQDYATGAFCSVLYEEGNYHAFTSAFNPSDLNGTQAGLISGNNATDEITYLALHWFEKPEKRKEARVTLRDVYISDEHPQIGNAYILRARVHNVGGDSINLLVRFMDGDMQIGADSISISPDNVTSAEIIWRPLFAGQRNITVLIDPIDEVDEIFEWFNNNVTFGIYVYFFWDDMESGGSKWSHSSTIVNINGEGPLDYFSSDMLLSTDIQDDWDWAESYGVENTTMTAHSYPSSYYMEEPQGNIVQGADVLASIVIDNSDSMTSRFNSTGASWLDVAKVATKNMIEDFTDNSVVSIYAFGGNNVITVIGMTQLAGAGRASVNSAIDGLAQGQMTLLWDAAGTAYMDVKISIPIYPTLFPAVIVLSDGSDFQSNDGSALPNGNKLEAASSEWAPWHDMQPELGYPQVNYPAGSHKGKYAIPYTEYGPGGSVSENGRWISAGGGSYNPLRKGLLTSDVPIYTIGLALEHFPTPYEPVTAVEPADWTVDMNAVWSGGIETGTNEYNLWRIADTSNASYFYASDADDLEGIFEELGQIISTGGFNQTRSASVSPGTRAAVENSDKRAVTEPFNLDDVETAQLSFWHRYNILQGGNGAFLQVAYRDPLLDSDGDLDPTNDWDYKYVIPPGQYTGGLYYDYNIYDDFGNLIKWCWNGLSGTGSFGWDYATLDILPYVPEAYRSEVRVAFNYTQFGGGTGSGWYIDDVQMVVSRASGTIISSDTRDIWNLTDTDSHSGNHSWCNIDPDTGEMKPGIDNSLMTEPIDLTNAKNVYLSAYFKFNINIAGGAPPDGFRVEISTDGGLGWTPINLGVRSSWGISGTGLDGNDGNFTDGKSYTGLSESGDPITDDYWVNASSLSRLNIDLSAYSGNQVLIRFRVATNNLPPMAYAHDNNVDYGSDPVFGGFYVDDVVLYGETIFG